MTLRLRFVTIAVGGAGALLLAGCAASYEERRDYLRTVAVRGAETHVLMQAQEVKEINKKRCEQAYQGLADDIPHDHDMGGRSNEWRGQVEQFFVDSCLSGVPKSLEDIPAVPSPGADTTDPPSSSSQSQASTTPVP